MAGKKKKEYRSFTLRVETKLYEKLKKKADKEKRSVNFICVEKLEA